MDYLGVKLCVNNKSKIVTISQLVAMFVEFIVVDVLCKTLSSLNSDTTDDDKYQVYIGICVPNSFFQGKDEKCALMKAIKMAKYNIDNSNKKFIFIADNVTIISSCLAGAFYQNYKYYFDGENNNTESNQKLNNNTTSMHHKIIIDISESNISTSIVETNHPIFLTNKFCKPICFKVFNPQSVEFVLWGACVTDAVDNIVNKIDHNTSMNNYSSSIGHDVRYKLSSYKKLAKLSKFENGQGSNEDLTCRLRAMCVFCNLINNIDVQASNFNFSYDKFYRNVVNVNFV